MSNDNNNDKATTTTTTTTTTDDNNNDNNDNNNNNNHNKLSKQASAPGRRFGAALQAEERGEEDLGRAPKAAPRARRRRDPREPGPQQGPTLRKSDFIHHHRPEGVVYRSFCLNSSTFVVS